MGEFGFTSNDRIKAKSITLKDFVNGMADNNKLNLDSDVGIVQEPLQIRVIYIYYSNVISWKVKQSIKV